jgi:hypothetical protein
VIHQRAARNLEWNAAGLAVYERAGFRRIGVRRGARISRGQSTDVALMDAVSQDFGASVLRATRRGAALLMGDSPDAGAAGAGLPRR